MTNQIKMTKTNHYCYKIILEGSDLFYTGRKSTTKDIDKCTYMGSGKWVKSIKDKSRLTKIILGVYDNIHDLKDAEQAFIEEWFDDPNCMNFARSSYGSAPGIHSHNYGSKRSEETRQKMSENNARLSGDKHPLYGKRGELSHMYGRKLPEKTRQKMSDKKKGKSSGENNSNAKINEATARQVKNMLLTESNHTKIANELNISKSIVKNIKYKNTWKHITT